jgi:hypothetical protein
MIACCEGVIYLELGNVRDLGSTLEFMASYAGACQVVVVVANFLAPASLLFLQVPLLHLNGQASQQIAKKESSGPW